MGDKRYMISDAARMVAVESHVLRYWEEELDIDIPRNEMGHRYYTDDHIEVMRRVRELKDRGFQLKAIRMVVPELIKNPNADIDTLEIMREELDNIVESSDIAVKHESELRTQSASNDKMQQFENIIGGIVTRALRENNRELGKEVGEQVSDNVIKEMDYMIRLQDERAEERFKRFDEILRNYQNGRKQIAVTGERKRIFRIGRKKDC